MEIKFSIKVSLFHNLRISLHYQTETEIGSAGEQPTRVKLDGRRKCKESKGCHLGNPLIFIEDLYA